jgi:3-phosphoshikimate 1-carboxyvinyltransferase
LPALPAGRPQWKPVQMSNRGIHGRTEGYKYSEIRFPQARSRIGCESPAGTIRSIQPYPNMVMSESIEIQPVTQPISGSIRPPGSKSITNRALIVAALADGESLLTGALDSQDTRVMIDSLGRLGLKVHHDVPQQRIQISGCAGRPPAAAAELWLENSGTSIRFLTALCTLGHGRYRLDGNARMRERPVQELADGLNQLGAQVHCELGNGCPPVIVEARGLRGGTARVGGSVSSQFLSALLMAVPGAVPGAVSRAVSGAAPKTAQETATGAATEGASSAVTIVVEDRLVSEPYVAMTLRVMEAFGVTVVENPRGTWQIAPQRYRARTYAIEPDASAASYFFAAAAITGGRVTVEGLSRSSLQGDVAFVDALAEMGCTVEAGLDSITLQGRPLRGIDIDMNAISDTAQTLSAVALFAAGPTRIRNVAHIRHKETDRIAAVAHELRRLGQSVEEHDDGLTIVPAPIRPATIATYDDHRMAMSFALIGLKAQGIRIADPQCTGKTYPHFFDDLARICQSR